MKVIVNMIAELTLKSNTVNKRVTTVTRQQQ